VNIDGSLTFLNKAKM